MRNFPLTPGPLSHIVVDRPNFVLGDWTVVGATSAQSAFGRLAQRQSPLQDFHPCSSVFIRGSNLLPAGHGVDRPDLPVAVGPVPAGAKAQHRDHSAAVGRNQIASYIAPPSHPLSCHSREGGNPGPLPRRFPPHQVWGRLWMPAFAGMTMVGEMGCDVKNLRKPRRFWWSVVQRSQRKLDRHVKLRKQDFLLCALCALVFLCVETFSRWTWGPLLTSALREGGWGGSLGFEFCQAGFVGCLPGAPASSSAFIPAFAGTVYRRSNSQLPRWTWGPSARC
jgi:hypothetical protein